MKINEVAKLTGTTIRTLHYYDEIGLLSPSSITSSSYRLYDNDKLETLQQILFFKELDFPLNEIKQIINNPNYNKNDSLVKQRELLVKKRKRFDKLIELINDTIKGDTDMSFEEFDMTEIEKAKKQYADEVKERWGITEEYMEYETKTNNYNKNQWKVINDEGGNILKSFSEIRDFQPSSNESQELVKKWQDYITANFYKCSKEILSGLGMMYINDERFRKNIDKYGDGTAEFIAKAIEIYCS